MVVDSLVNWYNGSQRCFLILLQFLRQWDSGWARGVIYCKLLWKPVKYKVITCIQIFIQQWKVRLCVKGNTKNHVRQNILQRLSRKNRNELHQVHPVYLRRERDRVWGFFSISYASASVLFCYVDQDPKNPNRWIPAYLLRETEEKHNTED